MTAELSKHQLPFSEACERNKEPILEVLKQHLPKRGYVLEIGSGSGQHAVCFAGNMSTIKWQPSEIAENLPGLKARIEVEGSSNIKPPIELDVRNDLSGWPDRVLSSVFTANTTHIMSWSAVRAMFEAVGQKMKRRGVFVLYGPFNVHGSYTSDSNRVFDMQLKSENAEMGLRDVSSLEILANKNDMELIDQVEMPANNLTLVFQRKDIERWH